MDRVRTSKSAVILLLVGFLLCGFLHVALYGVPLTDNIVQLVCGSVTVAWGFFVWKRVTDPVVRNLLVGVAGFLMMYFVLQFLRYKLITGVSLDIKRFTGYMYEIPAMMVILLCYYAAVAIDWDYRKVPAAAVVLPGVIAGVLLLGVLTNDLHFLAYSFPGGEMIDNGEEVRGILYYAAFLFKAVLLISAFVLVYWKRRGFAGRWMRWLPLLIGGLAVLYVILYILHREPYALGVRIWNTGDVYGFAFLGVLEACIQSGMIPANKDYEGLFSLSQLPVVIRDREGKICYRTAGAEEGLTASDSLEIRRHEIRTGAVEYGVDLSRVQELSRRLEEANRQIESRNDYLREENQLKKERARVETRSQMYDRIMDVLKLQTDQVDALLDEQETDLADRLPRIAVLSAYIKRRCNMEVLSMEGDLPFEELVTAVGESLEYLKLCGVRTAVSATGTGAFPPRMVTEAYEHGQALIESCLESLTDLAVHLSAGPDRLEIRMMIRADRVDFTGPPEGYGGSGFRSKLAVTTEGQDRIIVLTLIKGGEDE